MTGLVAVEMGAARRAQLLAAVTMVVAPVLVISRHLLSTTVFDILVWAVPAWLFARWLRTRRDRLRITIAYDISRDDQINGRYAPDSFPEENHNPFSDLNDFINVNSTSRMKRIAGIDQAELINNGPSTTGQQSPLISAMLTPRSSHGRRSKCEPVRSSCPLSRGR